MKKVSKQLLSFLLVVISIFNLFPAVAAAEHVHKGIVCGKRVEYYEDIDSNTHTYVVANENVCSCGEVIGYVDVKKTKSPHTFMANECTKCGYERKHVHKGVSTGKTVTKYENITSTTHTKVSGKENICKCGSVLGLVSVKETKQEHTFKNNVCTACGYVHKHKGVACGKLVEHYEQDDRISHYYVTAYENLCSCGKVMGTVDEKKTAERHNFKNDTCTKCGYKSSEHVHERTSQTTLTSYEDIGENTHTEVVETYATCTCGELIARVGYVMGTEQHSFVNDKCTKCGYAKVHVHKGVACGNAIKRYEDINANTHTLYTANEEICSCGAMLGYIDENRVTKNHSFNNDICMECGYKREHIHKGVACGDAIKRYEDINANTHTLYTANEEVCSCGAMLGYIDENRVTKDHNFNKDTCSECGYKREHVHVPYSCGDNIKYYEDRNASTHTYVEGAEEYCWCNESIGIIVSQKVVEAHSFLKDKCTKCDYEREHIHVGSVCGSEVRYYEKRTETSHTLVTGTEENCWCGERVNIANLKKNTSAHNFKNDKCIECGYTRQHVHKISKTADNGFTFYVSPTKTTHVKVFYEGDQLCDCNEVISSGNYSETTENHTFKNGKCTKCDAVQDGAKQEAVTLKVEVYYKSIDKEKHARIEVPAGTPYGRLDELFTSKNTTYKYEAHTFVNNKCAICGYKDYWLIAIEQTIKGDYAEDTNLAGFVGQVLGGEVLGVGTIADIRDLTASKTPEDAALNLLTLLPLGGVLKHADEIADAAKYSDEVVAVTRHSDDLRDIARVAVRESDHVDEYADSMRVIKKVSDSPDDAYSSYYKFKKNYGSAGEGYEWHHIVEQNQIKKSGIDVVLVQNGNNIIPLDAPTHRLVSGYYSRIVPGTNTSFRDWIASKNFTYEEQEKIGEYVLEMFGVIVE